MRAIPRLMLLATVVSLSACTKEKKQPEDAAATLARDTALAADLREVADTAAFSEAADVAMRDIPADSTMRSGGRTTTTVTRTPTMRTGETTPPRVPAETPPVREAPKPMTPTRPTPTPIPESPLPVRPAPDQPAPRSGTSVASGDYPTPACASPASADQRRCLLAYLARSDVGLDRNYQERIRRLRAEAGTPAGAPDPESVQRLRTAQRAWLVYRDTECRNRNRGREGALWAPVRAQCLGEFSRARAAELAP